jgi:pimeloyl-ACP methyl ester carboxylesterase
VVVSHGYSGDPDALSWLTENLASKGYVVAAPRHADPPITDLTKFPLVAAQRPLDITAVLQALRDPGQLPAALSARIDSGRVALIGYSMGGYGVLQVAGARLSPRYSASLPGANRPEDAAPPGVRAVVAISPAGGATGAWEAEGLADLRLPLLLVVGDQDHVVGYDPGVRTIFDGAVNAPRNLLVFEGAGHSIGMDAAPPEMRRRLWDLDWFEDPVWRKSRVIGVSLHFITAFLDLHLRGEANKAAFLDISPRSSDALWARSTPYDARSPGPPGASVWKGFHRRHTAGLLFERRGSKAPP